MVIEFNPLTGRRGNRGGFVQRGKSGLHRAACRVTPGESNLKDSVTEKKTALLGARGEESRTSSYQFPVPKNWFLIK